jgi:hypothetical protein
MKKIEKPNKNIPTSEVNIDEKYEEVKEELCDCKINKLSSLN